MPSAVVSRACVVSSPTWSTLRPGRWTTPGSTVGSVTCWRLKAQVDELAARLVAEADDRNLPHRYGASSTRAHLMTAHRMSAGEASRTVRTAKQLHGTTRLTEPTRRAVAAGDGVGRARRGGRGRGQPALTHRRTGPGRGRPGRPVGACARRCRSRSCRWRRTTWSRSIDPDTVDADPGAAARRTGTQSVGVGLVHRPVRCRRDRPGPVRPAEPGLRHAHETSRRPVLTPPGRDRHRHHTPTRRRRTHQLTRPSRSCRMATGSAGRCVS